MAKLQVGDQVECKLYNNGIVHCYAAIYDEIKKFEIILADPGGYSLYVPHYLNVKGSLILQKHHILDWHVDDKFLGEKCVFITDKYVYRAFEAPRGCACARCKDFYYMAEPNQEDGTMLCFLCRTYPFR